MKKTMFNLSKAAFDLLKAAQGVSFVSEYDFPDFDNGEWGGETATTVKLPSGNCLVGYERTNGEFYTQLAAIERDIRKFEQLTGKEPISPELYSF